uniref:Uncharacterized protein n=1 Tax=Oryza sativa subsp. japonica TaxID=39947 RepID=Q6H8E3_ORYSJ|nr:hypothetical protein [Oryza sativa Japonica Group]BAD25006.1 hypothetical protein [Oryza sativa Japonica Group]
MVTGGSTSRSTPSPALAPLPSAAVVPQPHDMPLIWARTFVSDSSVTASRQIRSRSGPNSMGQT